MYFLCGNKRYNQQYLFSCSKQGDVRIQRNAKTWKIEKQQTGWKKRTYKKYRTLILQEWKISSNEWNFKRNHEKKNKKRDIIIFNQVRSKKIKKDILHKNM